MHFQFQNRQNFRIFVHLGYTLKPATHSAKKSRPCYPGSQRKLFCNFKMRNKLAKSAAFCEKPMHCLCIYFLHDSAWEIICCISRELYRIRYQGNYIQFYTSKQLYRYMNTSLMRICDCLPPSFRIQNFPNIL